MTEHKDMTISEIEEVLKEYTCEFVRGRDNYYYNYVDENFIHITKTNYDFTQNFYFNSKEKINDFMEKVGESNFKKFSKNLNKDFKIPNMFDDANFLNECEIIRDKIKQYFLKEENEKYNIYTIKPFKENGKYTIKYIKIDSYKDVDLGDNCFETLEDAEKCVNEIGEYNILHYYFFIKDEFLEKDTTKHKDMTLDEIYDIVKEYKCDFREGEDNWYVYFTEGMYGCKVTKDSPIHLIYFKSEDKVYEFMRKVGYVNFSKLFDYLYSDKYIIDDIFNERKDDIVKNPSHYQGKNGLEVYEVLENFLPDVESYYLGNVIKYILRYKNKNGLEDLKKAREYLNKMIERLNDGE